MQIGEPMAYNIIFYEKQNGESELWNFLEKLRKKSATSKDARIQFFYFFCDKNDFVLLHSFRKKTQKTPRREIEKAKSERDDYLSRKES